MGLLVAISIPLIQGIAGSGAVNQASDTLWGAFESARVYAMANHTYARVAVSQITTASGHSALALISIYSIDGTNTNPMSVSTDWPNLNRPQIINNFVTNDNLNSTTPNTAQDQLPSQSTIGTMTQTINGQGAIEFTFFVEFNPAGEASINEQGPAHYIKIGIDEAAPRSGRNPFILRLSGTNGTLTLLRKESLTSL